MNRGTKGEEGSWAQIMKPSGTIHNDTKQDEGSWAQPMQHQEYEVSRLIADMDKKSSVLAEKMLDIVNTERELAEKEKIERRRIAWERRQEKKGGAVESGGKDEGGVRQSVRRATVSQTLLQSSKDDDKAEKDALSELEDTIVTEKMKRPRQRRRRAS
jgi:soluble P-type ATPase